MSSSRKRRSSVPNRLGQGIRRRTTMSTKPRKATTVPKVAAIDKPVLQPLWRWYQKKNQGLGKTATTGAAPVSRRPRRDNPAGAPQRGRGREGSAPSTFLD